MGRTARPLHDPGNNGAIERGSNLQAARRGGLMKPAKPAGERKNTAALTPSLGTRSKNDVLKTYIERKHELRYTCSDFFVIERDAATYLVRNHIWTAIDTPDFQAEEQRLTVVINATLHEFPDRNEFSSFCSHFQDYLDVAD